MSYPPPYYTDDDPAFARRIMEQHGFALLIAGGLQASHLPLQFVEGGGQGRLYGHLSRNNPLCEHLTGGDALAVFSGPHGYVSASLYDKPQASVPTWNYASVQVRGSLHACEEDETVPHLEKLAQQYEGDAGWSVSNAPDYVNAIKRGIITVRIEVTSILAFRKMSGNKNPAIRKRIIDAARASGEEAFATEMETL